MLGITGGIAMGKSTCVAYLRNVLGVEVHDADEAVHKLYGAGGAATGLVMEAFGEEVAGQDGSVDRTKLSKLLMSLSSEEKRVALERLESIVHPLVTADREAFVARLRGERRPLVAVDIPLLFETMVDPSKCGIDRVVAVSCEVDEQRRRALDRPNMTPAKLEAILARQMPDSERSNRADFVVDTSYAEKSAARSQLASIVEAIWPRKLEQPCPIRAVSLDLDDTLWPTRPPLEKAARATLEKWPSLLPNSYSALGPDAARDFLRYFKAHVEAALGPTIANRLQHDITAQRKAAFRALADKHGDDRARADQLVEHLVQQRSEATDAFLDQTTLDALGNLKSKGLVVGALTNGNAYKAGRLADLLHFWLRAQDLGASKPSLVPFLAAAHAANCSLASLVHVGDSLQDDVIGALRAGARAVLFDPNQNIPNLPAALQANNIQACDRCLRITSIAELPTALADSGWLVDS